MKPIQNTELGPMHDSGPNGCHEDCEACAREIQFSGATRRALAWVNAGNRLEAAPCLWQAHANAPDTDARARIVGVLEELRANKLDAAETRLPEVIETACFD